MGPFQNAVIFSCLFVVCALPLISSKNILIYNAVGTHSTRISMWPYVEALVNKGHNVTFVSPYPSTDSIKHTNLHYYVPAKWSATMGPWEDHLKFYDIRKNKKLIESWYNIWEMGTDACRVLFSDPDFVDWAKSSKFDLVVIECIVNECAYGLAHYFNAKVILYSTTVAWPHYMDAHGLPDESASITDLILNFPPGNQMTFFQRLVNAIHPVVFYLKRYYQYFPAIEEITRKGLGLEDIPSFAEIERNVSLVFLTTHYSLDYPKSFPPNVIPIGGAGVADKKFKPLPKNVESFISTAKEGFVFISFGTVAEFTNFEEFVQQEFIDGLRKFPELKFIWKSTNKINATMPSNILVTKWVPQQTLLAHPNIKAFITHSGMGSITEAIYFSVPLVCVPVLAEQDINANVISRRGAGITVEIIGLKAQDLEEALSEVLHNKKYRLAMNELTEIFKDRQVAPVDNAVWWTEFVMKYDSNKFIVSPSTTQPWWIKRQLDVWLFALVCLLGVISVAILSLYYVTRQFMRVISKDSSSKSSQKKKQS